MWTAMTVGFQAGFGHHVAKQSWSTLRVDYDRPARPAPAAALAATAAAPAAARAADCAVADRAPEDHAKVQGQHREEESACATIARDLILGRLPRRGLSVGDPARYEAEGALFFLRVEQSGAPRRALERRPSSTASAARHVLSWSAAPAT